MIDFRYHLVSIIAVFLALAVGVVLGSAALNGPITAVLRKSVATLRADENDLHSQNRSLQGQIKSDQQFAEAAEPVLLDRLLAGERVVLVTAPGAPGQMTGQLTKTLTLAGAKVTGEVDVKSKFFDSSSATRSTLGLLTQRFTPSGTTLRSGGAQAQAGQLIASALVTQDGTGQPASGSTDSAGTAILSDFESEGFLSVSVPAIAHATLAVVITPASPSTTNDSNAASQALVTLCQQLNLADQSTVVAGSVTGSGPGSAIDVMRSGGRAGHLSSVDDADLAIGQIAVAQAMYLQLTVGKSGSYGIGSGATAPGPSPAPTPSPSPSPSGSAGGATASKRTTHPAATPTATSSR